MRRFDWFKILGLLAIAVGAGVFWNSPFFTPIKVFVVFLHEASHALAALATGGEVKEMRVLLHEAGVVQSLGGSPFWTLMAGYVGSLLWGGVLLVVSSRTSWAKALAVLLGMGMVALTLLYMANSSGLLFGVGFGAALILVGTFLPKVVAEWVLRGLGLVSCLYAIYDIASDVLLNPSQESDASLLAERTGFPPFLSEVHRTLFWGGLWMVLALIGTWIFLAWALRPPKSQREFL